MANNQGLYYYTKEEIDELLVPATVTASDYVSFTVGRVSNLQAYKFGRFLYISFDLTNVNTINGEKTIGSCTNKVAMASYGAGRAASSGDAIPATFIFIPSGAIRVHTTASRLNCAGSAILMLNA